MFWTTIVYSRQYQTVANIALGSTLITVGELRYNLWTPRSALTLLFTCLHVTHATFTNICPTDTVLSTHEDISKVLLLQGTINGKRIRDRHRKMYWDSIKHWTRLFVETSSTPLRMWLHFKLRYNRNII